MATRLEVSQRIDKIVLMVESGEHINLVAETFSLKPHTVRGILNKRGVVWYKGQFSGKDISEMIQLYSDNVSSTEIARKYDTSSQNVLSALRKHGVTPKTKQQVKDLTQPNANLKAFIEGTELSSYLFGWILTDGCFRDSGMVSLELSRKDENILHLLKEYVGIDNKVIQRDRFDKRTGNTYSMSSFSFTNQTIASNLRTLGLSPRKSLQEKCPENLQYDRHFWRGVFEGDGHIAKKGNMLSLVGSLELVESFYTFCRSICGEMKGTISRSGKMHVAQICNKPHVTQVLDAFYSDSAYVLPRKHQVYLDRYTGN